MGSKDHGVQQKLIQMVIKLCGATAIWHALAGCLWGHQMLVELVLVGQTQTLCLTSMTTAVAELVVVGQSVLLVRRQKTVFLLGQNGSSMQHCQDTIKLC